MSKLKLKYYIEFSELVDKEVVTNMSEEAISKFKKATEEYFYKLLKVRVDEVTDVSVNDLKVEFDLEEV